MNRSTPIKLSPAYQDYLWGGCKLKEQFNKKCDLDVVAESWELSVHKNGQSTVASGEYAGKSFGEYLDAVGKGVLGRRSARFDYFPLLIKFIDAKGSLSVQVHPSDEYALEHEGEYGKTEMWYILDCEEGASLYYGFSRDVTKEEYERAIKEERLTELLNSVPVKRGDVFFIPSGTVHAIGAGIIICEIQQNSNTTYRVYDYGRRDKNGNTRQLHVEKALEVSDLKKSPSLPKTADADEVILASCEYFEVKRLRTDGQKAIFSDDESFLSLIVTDGEGILEYDSGSLDLVKGDSIFIPAEAGELTVKGKCELIISRVGEKNN